jgi:oligopeptide/dipeptide ABC transporter ATP-binding protein
MVLRPSLIIADEPLSMVDVSARADIVNLILRLREDFGTAFVYVTHDVATARHLCSQISVMYAGRIVESGDVELVLSRPSHPYSDLLRSAVPLADPVVTRRRVADGGEPPPPTDIPTGCAFRTRCPRAQERCVTEDPALRALLPEVDVACHYPLTSDAPLLERTG